MTPEGGVALPLPRHQTVQLAAGHGQVEQGRVWQKLHEMAKDKAGKVFKAYVVAIPSVFSGVHNLPHYFLRLGKKLHGSFRDS